MATRTFQGMTHRLPRTYMCGGVLIESVDKRKIDRKYKTLLEMF